MIEKQVTKYKNAIAKMLMMEYNLRLENPEGMEINGRKIIQASNCDKSNYFDIQKDITEILTKADGAYSYKVNLVNDTVVVSIKALA